ncbi:PAS domain S-box protein [Methylomonas sp. SURF-1]|uniref:histidine kinase n=1 Tax=Methylomonas aurea TaxID=2952224 RepID=A0ABT1UF18_9GAMM|nr:PAS domain S-box protein [Methylomonas sp. SURF-1]MCQ8180824.1 PAS domain S-box protein [Methylomonas sp. SURF-1]
MLQTLIGQSAAILESYSIALVVTKERHIVWANRAMHAMFGYERDELIGQSTRILFVDQESYDAFGREVHARLETDDAYNGSFPLKRKDSSVGWYEFNISHLAGHPESTVGAIVDRTESHHTRRLLEESEARFRMVVEDQTEVISRFLPDGTFVFVNDVYCRLFGKTREQLIGQRWHPVVHPDDLAMVEARLRTMSPDHRLVFIENRVVVGGGALRWMQFANRGFYDAASQLKEIQSVGRDITRLKEIENGLRESEAQLQRAQAVGRIGSFQMDANDKDVFKITQETARLFDLDDKHVATVDVWFARIHPEDRDKAEAAWCAALQGEPYDLVYRIVVRGQIRWIRALAELEFDRQGQWLNAVGTVQDISDLKQAEAAQVKAQQHAEHANRAKTRFLAAASHDLRQPLQAILLLIEVLKAHGLNEKQQEIVQQLSRSSRALGDILNQLLDMSKLEAGAIQADPETICSQDLLVMIKAEFAPLAAANQLRFDLFRSRRCPLLYTDRQLLMNLMRNLVGNAVKFTERGRILIAIRPRGNRALIQVWDTGIGIPRQALNAIFDEYVQINNPERDRAKGVGLGLSIGKRLAKLLDTEIHCRSELDRGSMFEFSVPLDASCGIELAPSTAETGAVAGSGLSPGKRVLIVEDDPDLGKALKLAFEMQGLQVLLFRSAEAAQASPTFYAADYYLCDYRLPGIDGLQFLDAVRQAAPGPIRAVLLTGETTSENLARMKESGWPVLGKPVKFDSLLSTLEACSDESLPETKRRPSTAKRGR